MTAAAQRRTEAEALLAGFRLAARGRRKVAVALLGLVIAMAAISLAVGPSGISFSKLFSALSGEDEIQRVILFEIRTPRLLLSLIIGAGLGLCGAAAQALTRNPLADPSVFGAPQAAALGAVGALYFSFAGALSIVLPLAAVTGAALSMLFVALMVRRRFSVTSMLLAGLAIGSLCAAAISLVLSLSSNPFALTEIVFWLMGSFADRSFTHVWISAPLMLIGMAIVLRLGPSYRMLSLGEDTARAMGVGVGRVALATAAGVALTVGAATSVAGSIAFVGLMAPHLVRHACGSDPHAILVPSMLSGAALTIGADILVRLLPSTSEIPVGVVTALLGAPFFLFLVLSRRAMFGGLNT
jgi:iron complex transport system permease protein